MLIGLVGVGGLAFAVCVFALWAVFRSSFFQVQSLSIEGNVAASRDEIIGFLRTVVPGNGIVNRALGFSNILVWPGDIASSDLRLIPKLKTIAIAKNIPSHAITVSVVEHVPQGVWCIGDSEKCFWFDDAGMVFESAPVFEGNLIRVVNDYAQGVGLGSSVLSSQEIGPFMSVLRALDRAEIRVKEIRYENTGLQELHVRTYDGPDIYFSLRFDESNTAAALASLKAAPGGIAGFKYIDFRVENKAFYQ